MVAEDLLHPEPPDAARPLTVTELAMALNRVVEESFATVRFQGEIGELSRPSSGHIYFTVKDVESQLSAVMWRSSVQRLRFQPRAGMEVVCIGQPNVYNKTGRLQLVVRSMEEAGQGALQRKFQALKAKLESEGLFAPERKRPIPFFPRSVGVVTSASGAAVHDIMARARERMPSIPITLHDVRVQGEGAAAEIAAAIKYFNDQYPVDVLIVGRGGGSLEDLWAFNEEVVVRAIFASRIPIVSAVGHETDITLSDLVADVRAPTPTAAAEMVLPARVELLRQLSELERRLHDWERWLQPHHQDLDTLEGSLQQAVERTLSGARSGFDLLEGRLEALAPARLVALRKEQISAMQLRLVAQIEALGERSRSNFRAVATRFSRVGLSERVSHAAYQVQTTGERFRRSIDEQLLRLRSQLEHQRVGLESLNPRRVLERGYSVVWHSGVAVRAASELAEGAEVRLQFAKGEAAAKIVK